MADSYTTSLRIVQMPTGSNDRLWGVKADAAFAMLEQAIAGGNAVSLTAADVVLTTANNASDQARNMILNFTGTPGVVRTVTVPNVSKLTLMINSSDSDMIVTAGGAVNGTIKAGTTAFVLADGGANVFSFLLKDLPGRGILPQIFAHESL